MSRFLRATAMIAPLLLLAAPGAWAQTADPARAPVEALDEGLIAMMKSGAGAQARGASIAPVVDRVFDLPLMTRLSVGPPWTTISPADQTALTAAFRRMTIAHMPAISIASGASASLSTRRSRSGRGTGWCARR